MGDLLTKILNEIESGSTSAGAEASVIKLGVSQLPEVARDNTDRNRTSPFAFTGNKFEFRAVGSSASTAFPITLLNAAVADGFEEVTALLKERMKGGKSPDAAIMDVLKHFIKETKTIRFEGNNYSEEWVKEAEKRGLPNLKKTPEALAELTSKKSKEMLTRLGVFTEAEINSRHHVRIERYVKNLLIEIDTLRSMVSTQILPACYGYHGELASAAASAKAAGVTAPQSETLSKLGELIGSLQTKRTALEKAVHKVEGLGSEEDKAKAIAIDVSNIMFEIRSNCDELENIVADDFWPMPKYREMLFLA
jgi:glutamine synthetase